MKKVLFFILGAIVLASCGKNDETGNYFSFKINGKQTSYQYYSGIGNFYKKGFTLIIAGDSADLFKKANEVIEILAKINDKMEFDLNDSLITVFRKFGSYEIYSAPRTNFDLSFTNFNIDSIILDRNSTNFHLVINSYDITNKIMSGTFEGLLRNHDNSDSIIITDGSFKITLEMNSDRGFIE